MKVYNPTLDFSDAPTVGRFILDETFIRIIIGAVGSGKSTGMTTELMRLASIQDVDPDTNTRRSRFAIIRNTGPELKTTTIKTWIERWPEEACGPVKYSAPITQRIKRPPRNGRPGLDAEFIFIPLDEEKDVAKLKSLDLTGAWINEGSEVPRAIFDMLDTRVGRFPPRDDKKGVACRQKSIIVDTNAYDEDHYLNEIEAEQSKKFKFFRQPPAVLEVELRGSEYISIEPGYKGIPFHEQHVYRAAGRFWAVNPGAENLGHLEKTYYQDQIEGKKLDWIQKYLQVKNVYVQDGKPCVPNYVDEVYSFETLPVLKNEPLKIGGDIGGGTLNPASLIYQVHPRGNILIHDEVVVSDMGVKNFVSAIKHRLSDRFPGMPLAPGWGDPAGEQKDELYETVIFDYLNAHGIPMQAASTNDPHARIGAIVTKLDTNIDGKPALMINKRCRILRKALSGAWHYKRMKVKGEERYQEKPDKTHPWSDVGDGLGYICLGEGGEVQLRGGETGNKKWAGSGPVKVKVDFDIF